MTISRTQTALLFASRSVVNETTDGDFWKWAYNYSGISDAHYNDIVDAVNLWEDAADNSNLIGTKPDNTTFSISGMPSRPRPVKRP